ncbi:MAG: hypothetical protein MK207_11965 [Saprospiraceae bacterium]|nr:hypothetical protein [Saprospiraceae bacterium]
MKKILFILVVVSIAFYGCEPEETPFAATLNTNSITETGSVTATKNMTVILTNSTSTNGSVAWSFTETSSVTGWTYSICINGAVQNGTSGTFDLTGNGSATVMVMVQANGFDGTGTASMSFTESNNSIGTVSYSYTATSTPSAPNFSLSVTSDTNSTSSSGSPKRDYKTLFTNLTNDTLQFTWLRIDDPANPSGWFMETCDMISCWVPTTITGVNDLPPNSSFEFKTTVNTAGIVGTGSVTTLFYEETDSAGTVQSHSIYHTHN